MEACPSLKVLLSCYLCFMICLYYLLLSLLPWQWFSFTLMLHHKIYELFYLWCQTNLKLQGKLCNKCPSGNSSETAVLVTFLCDLWLYIERQSPRRPCDILVANVGPEIAKTAKYANLTKMCQNCQKMCKAQKVSKLPKTALSGLSQEFWKECVLECSVSARVFTQGPDRPRSLVQPSPADSSQVRAQEPCPAAQRPRESA